jgi:hypothetical protein
MDRIVTLPVFIKRGLLFIPLYGKQHSLYLVISQNGQGMTAFYHTPDNLKGLSNFLSPINKIPDKNRLSFRMYESHTLFLITQPLQQGFKQRSAPVNISDDVKHENNLNQYKAP